MTLNLGSPWLSRLSYPSPNCSKFSFLSSNNNQNSFLFLLFESKNTSHSSFSTFSNSKAFKAKASLSESGSGVAENSSSPVSEELLNDELLTRVSGAKDANEALEVIAELSERNGGVVNASDCCSIISAALERNNSDLALSVFYAMRSSFDQGIKLTDFGIISLFFSALYFIFRNWRIGRLYKSLINAINSVVSIFYKMETK